MLSCQRKSQRIHHLSNHSELWIRQSVIFTLKDKTEVEKGNHGAKPLSRREISLKGLSVMSAVCQLCSRHQMDYVSERIFTASFDMMRYAKTKNIRLPDATTEGTTRNTDNFQEDKEKEYTVQ